MLVELACHTKLSYTPGMTAADDLHRRLVLYLLHSFTEGCMLSSLLHTALITHVGNAATAVQACASFCTCVEGSCSTFVSKRRCIQCAGAAAHMHPSS